MSLNFSLYFILPDSIPSIFASMLPDHLWLLCPEIVKKDDRLVLCKCGKIVTKKNIRSHQASCKPPDDRGIASAESNESPSHDGQQTAQKLAVSVTNLADGKESKMGHSPVSESSPRPNEDADA